jgi:membrane protease YdiL (CAAX protease family)
MSRVNEITESLSGKLTTVLSGKPIWVSWAVYTLLSGVFLGVTYALMHLLLLRWWVAVVAVIAIGMIWGTSAHKMRQLGTEGEQES